MCYGFFFYPQLKFVKILKRESSIARDKSGFCDKWVNPQENKVILNLHLHSIASKYITQKLKELTGEIDKSTLIINTTEFPNSVSYNVLPMWPLE